MQIYKFIFLVVLLVSSTLLIGGCENFSESDEINGLIKSNDLSLNIKASGSNGFTIAKTYDSETDYYVKIDVTDTFSLRGEAAITPGHQYRLTIIMKNISSDPVINYSFWEKPKTSLRHYTFKGENGNPPTSETKQIYTNWMTFEETFETREGEDTFMLTLNSGEGTFYIKEISIEDLQ